MFFSLCDVWRQLIVTVVFITPKKKLYQNINSARNFQSNCSEEGMWNMAKCVDFHVSITAAPSSGDGNEAERNYVTRPTRMKRPSSGDRNEAERNYVILPIKMKGLQWYWKRGGANYVTRSTRMKTEWKRNELFFSNYSAFVSFRALDRNPEVFFIKYWRGMGF